MSQQVTANTLLERARKLCGLPEFTTETIVSTADALDLLQESCALLGAIVKEASGQNYLSAYTALTTIPSVDIVSLPAQCSDLLRLSWLRSEDEEIDLVRARREEYRSYPNEWNGSITPYYTLLDNVIHLFPTPDAAYALRVYYNTGLYVTTTSDTFILRDYWGTWITMQLCRFFRMTQQIPAMDFEAQQAEAEAKIRGQLRRDKFGIQQARDVRGTRTLDRIRSRLPWTF